MLMALVSRSRMKLNNIAGSEQALRRSLATLSGYEFKGDLSMSVSEYNRGYGDGRGQVSDLMLRKDKLIATLEEKIEKIQSQHEKELRDKEALIRNSKDVLEIIQINNALKGKMSPDFIERIERLTEAI